MGLLAVARSTPDGHKLLATSNGSVAIAGNLRQVSYDAETDVVPVAMLEKTPLRHRGQRFASNQKHRRTSEVFQGEGRRAELRQLGGRLLLRGRRDYSVQDRRQSGFRALSRSSVDGAWIRAGEVDMGITDLTSLMPFVQEGTIRILALIDSSRTARGAGIPTVSESGIPGLGLNAWLGVFAPRGTPPNLSRSSTPASTRHWSCRRSSADTKAGIEPWIMSPQQMAEFVQDEIALWKNLIREANVKLQQ